MKVLPFKISKPENTALVYQEDQGNTFYNKYHQHQEIQLSLIVQGEGTLVVGDSINEYQNGDLFVIGSNLPHVFKSDLNPGKKSHMISIFMNKDSFGADLFELDEFDVLQALFKQSIYGLKLISNQEQISALILAFKGASKLERLILLFKVLQIMSASKSKRLSSFVYEKNYTDNEGKRMSDIFEYTMDRFAGAISISQIAEVANLTTNAFCKYFKQRTSKTYLQFLTEIRIEHACKLLQKNRDLPVADIAVLSGFNNISNFNRKFKILKKTTPLQYKLSTRI